MEPDSKSRKIYKRKKGKSKRSSSRKNVETIVDPKCFDGMSNWMNLQKTLEVSEEKAPKNLKKAESVVKSFKKIRLSTSKSSSSMSQKEKNLNSSFSDKNDSGCISGSELSPKPSNTRPRQNGKITENDQNINPDDLNELTNVLSIDCEMVGTGVNGKDSMLARVSIVNSYGQCVYDTFVKPKERITDFRTAVSGVRPVDIKNGKDLFEVQKDVSKIIEGRKLVGHALKHDFKVLYVSHPRHLIRDTSKYKPFREACGGKTPSLKKLTSMFLGCDIQGGEHSSVEDAQAAMLLYLRHKREWEKQIKSNRKRRVVKETPQCKESDLK